MQKLSRHGHAIKTQRSVQSFLSDRKRATQRERAGKWAHSQHASISLLRSLCLGRSFCCCFSSFCQCISLSIGSRPLQKQPTSWSVPDCIKWVTSRRGGFFCFPLIVLFIKFYHELVEWPAFNTEGTYQWERIYVYLGLPGFLGLTIFTRKAAHFPILLWHLFICAKRNAADLRAHLCTEWIRARYEWSPQGRAHFESC